MIRPGTLIDFKALMLLIIILLVSGTAFAHFIFPDTYNLTTSQTIAGYLSSGYKHVFLAAKEHITLMVSIFLISPKGKSLTWQLLLFTFADLIGFSINAFHLSISIPMYFVEPFFAAVIIVVSVQNIMSKRIFTTRYLLIMGAALVHSLSFETTMKETVMPKDQHFIYDLIYNIGVELGQLTVIFLLIALAGNILTTNKNSRKKIVMPCSLILICIAAFNFIKIFLVTE